MTKPTLLILAAGMGGRYGVTYREDRARVIESVRALVAASQYPQWLWA